MHIPKFYKIYKTKKEIQRLLLLYKRVMPYLLFVLISGIGEVD